MNVRAYAKRAGLIAGAVLVLAFATGARCIENSSVAIDPNGYGHAIGEIYNDTDIQGKNMQLRAELFDSSGALISEVIGPLCPPQLGPKSFNMFDLTFPLRPFPDAQTTYSVKVISGESTDVALPNPNVAILATSAKYDGQVVLRIDVKNNSGIEYKNLNACAVTYDAAGKVRSAKVAKLSNDTEPGEGLGSKPDYILLHVPRGEGATHVRGWIWFAGADGKQSHQAIVTGKVLIEN